MEKACLVVMLMPQANQGWPPEWRGSFRNTGSPIITLQSSDFVVDGVNIISPTDKMMGQFHNETERIFSSTHFDIEPFAHIPASPPEISYLFGSRCDFMR